MTAALLKLCCGPTPTPSPDPDPNSKQVTAALLKLHRDEPSVFMMAYRAWLGSNKGRLRELGWTTAELVRRSPNLPPNPSPKP